MKYFTVGLLISLFLISGGCYAYWKGQSSPSGSDQRLYERLPDDDKINHVLDRRANLSGFEDFGRISLTNDELELRIWVTGGFEASHGLILSRRNQTWAGSYLPPLENADQKPNAIDLTAIMVDPSLFLESIDNKGILDVPTESEIRDQTHFYDGQLITIQYNRGSGKKIVYSSIEPCAQNSKFGTRTCDLMNAVRDNFNVKLLSLPEEQKE